MRLYPNEIEADLDREYGRDILDWWRGRFSSRKLLALLEGLSDDSALKKELTESGWPEWVDMLAKIHELTALNFGAKYTPNQNVKTYVAPKERLKKLIEAERQKQFQKETEDDLMSQLGWT